MNTHRVKRTFPAARPVSAGQLVDASNWRNRALLERGGYIEPIEQATEVVSETGPANETAEAAEVEPVEVQEILTPTETPTATAPELPENIAPAEEKLPETAEVPAAATHAEAPAATAPVQAPKTAKTGAAKKSTSKAKK